MKTLSIALAAFLVMGFSQSAISGQKKGNGNDDLPNGKPFQLISSQIEALQQQVDDLVGQVDSLEDLIAGNENAIAALEAQNADLLQAINANDGDIDALQEQVDLNTLMIENLQGQVNDIEDALVVKQNVINGSCPAGEAISQINADGSVVCQVMNGSGADTSFTTFKVYNYSEVPKRQLIEASVTCPAGTILTGGAAALVFTDSYSYYASQFGGTSTSDNIFTAKAQGAVLRANGLTVIGICIQ